jgi:CSLREA domain-containing protein
MSYRFKPLSSFLILATLIAMLAIPTPASADTFSVNTEDDTDDGHCNNNHCSLREAINAANANIGPDLIEFSSLDASSQEVRIDLMSPLPPLLDNGTTIDGTTVGGYAGIPRVLVVEGIPTIEEGINIQGSNCTIRALSMAGFGLPLGEPYPPIEDYIGGAIVLSGGGNLIENNVLGWGAWGNSVGLNIPSSGNSVIGNVISGNGIGIFIRYHSQVIQGNIVGLDETGTMNTPNAYGIYDHPASGGGHQIGGSGAGQGNIISGNTFSGLKLQSDNNVVDGNYIGTDISGSTAIPNHSGISLLDAQNNMVVQNLISGNTLYGVISQGNAEGTRLYGNQIGSDITGTFAIPNETGVEIFGWELTVGGVGPSQSNLIFGNPRAGIWISYEAYQHVIEGNTITQNGGAYNGGGIAFSMIGAPGHRISQNSIFDNGGLGIQEGGLNPMTPPWIMSASGSTVTGGTCSNCEVEIFRANPDPSGSGEGELHLGTLYANASGDFTGTINNPGFCQQITATAFDPSQHRTSEFSLNFTVNCFMIEIPFLIPIWVFIITVFGVLGILLRRRNPARTPALVPGGFVVGILVAAGLTLLGNSLPGVMIGSPPEDTVPYSGQPPACDDFLDPAGFAPASGAVLESYEEAMLEWSPAGDLPEGSIRWLVEVEDYISQSASQVTPENSIPLASFNLAPLAGQAFGWTVQGQLSVDGGNTWLPFCNGLPGMTFMFSQEAVEEAEEATEEEPVPSEEPEDCEAELTALMNLTCRSGPDAIYEELGFLLEGETAIPEGISSDGLWYWILNPDWQGHCFVWSGGVEATCLGDLEIINVPEPSPVPLQCLPSLDQEECEEAGGTFFYGASSASCLCPED